MHLCNRSHHLFYPRRFQLWSAWSLKFFDKTKLFYCIGNAHGIICALTIIIESLMLKTNAQNHLQYDYQCSSDFFPLKHFSMFCVYEKSLWRWSNQKHRCSKKCFFFKENSNKFLLLKVLLHLEAAALRVAVLVSTFECFVYDG